jgi:glucose/arabinose dehydrogenase
VVSKANRINRERDHANDAVRLRLTASYGALSGMAFYTGDLLPQWKGNLFLGGLASSDLIRLELDGDKVVHEERLLKQRQQRIRDVRQGPDGALYVLVDAEDGMLLKITP